MEQAMQQARAEQRARAEELQRAQGEVQAQTNQRAELEAQLARSRCEAAALRSLDVAALDRLEDELQEGLKRIRDLRRTREEERYCSICMERPKDTVLIPCGHMLCSTCQPQLTTSEGRQKCHECRQFVERHVRTYG